MNGIDRMTASTSYTKTPHSNICSMNNPFISADENRTNTIPKSVEWMMTFFVPRANAEWMMTLTLISNAVMLLENIMLPNIMCICISCYGILLFFFLQISERAQSAEYNKSRNKKASELAESSGERKESEILYSLRCVEIIIYFHTHSLAYSLIAKSMARKCTS